MITRIGVPSSQNHHQNYQLAILQLLMNATPPIWIVKPLPEVIFLQSRLFLRTKPSPPTTPPRGRSSRPPQHAATRTGWGFTRDRPAPPLPWSRAPWSPSAVPASQDRAVQLRVRSGAVSDSFAHTHHWRDLQPPSSLTNLRNSSLLLRNWGPDMV